VKYSMLYRVVEVCLCMPLESRVSMDLQHLWLFEIESNTVNDLYYEYEVVLCSNVFVLT